MPPPGQGGTAGPHDKFGPGTRVPTLLVSRHFAKSTIDHTQYDTTSILATIEHRYGVAPVGEVYSTAPGAVSRDAAVKDFASAIRAAGN